MKRLVRREAVPGAAVSCGAMPPYTTVALLLAALLLAPQSATPQTPGVGEEVSQPQPTWSKEVDFGFKGSAGNAEALSVDLGTKIQHQGQRWDWELDGDLTFDQIEKKDNKDDHERYSDLEINNKLRRNLSPRFYALLISSADHRPRSGIDAEWLGGTGLGWHLDREGETRLSAESAVAFTHERQVEGARLEYVSLTLETKLASHAFQNATLTWSNQLRFGLGEGSDAKSDQTVDLENPLSRRFSLKVELEWEHNSHPPEGHLKNDYRLATSLVLKL